MSQLYIDDRGQLKHQQLIGYVITGVCIKDWLKNYFTAYTEMFDEFILERFGRFYVE